MSVSGGQLFDDGLPTDPKLRLQAKRRGRQAQAHRSEGWQMHKSRARDVRKGAGRREKSEKQDLVRKRDQAGNNAGYLLTVKLSKRLYLTAVQQH
ncbi:hypothetical protein CHARACLAT_022265 [Characodon lateralis]|uniref:Uncharacterized protein n=1 Tax=Characodon lateralis TaxID=208331 RepID=A0ABU7EL96_9TELE|nr:hypothetical protein [Characodon lateralis]